MQTTASPRIDAGHLLDSPDFDRRMAQHFRSKRSGAGPVFADRGPDTLPMQYVTDPPPIPQGTGTVWSDVLNVVGIVAGYALGSPLGWLALGIVGATVVACGFAMWAGL